MYSAVSHGAQASFLPRIRRLQGRVRVPSRLLTFLLLSHFTVGLLYNHAALEDEQLYLLIAVLLSFSQVPSSSSFHSQNASFTQCLFTLPATPQDFAFFTERSDSDSWSVGCLLLVLLIRILTAHLHEPNVMLPLCSHSKDFYLLSAIMALICNLFRQACNLDRCPFPCLVMCRYTSRRLVELLLSLTRHLQALKAQEDRVDDMLINTCELAPTFTVAPPSFFGFCWIHWRAS